MCTPRPPSGVQPAIFGIGKFGPIATKGRIGPWSASVKLPAGLSVAPATNRHSPAPIDWIASELQVPSVSDEYAPGVGELFAVGVGGEGAVGDAVDAQPSAVAGEELAVHAHAPRRDGHMSVAGESFAGLAFGRPDHYGRVVHSHRPRE